MLATIPALLKFDSMPSEEVVPPTTDSAAPAEGDAAASAAAFEEEQLVIEEVAVASSSFPGASNSLVDSRGVPQELTGNDRSRPAHSGGKCDVIDRA